MRMTPAPTREDINGVSLVRLDAVADEWVAVVHPLWNWDNMITTSRRLAEFSDTRRVEPISTFDLARRPAGSIDAARRRLAG
jgi:hypothetical protein